MELLEKIKPLIDQHTVISFDIFDTLLLRPYVNPTDLFVHLERLENTDGFAKARIEAEKEARKKRTDLEDINIDEIYDEIDIKYQPFKEKEMALERHVLMANPEMKEVYDYASKQGKRIIIISDMYLPKEFLANVLKEKGYNGFEKVYVSCEYRKTKWTGNLYKLVMEDLQCLGKDVLHIGDNADSDKNKAEKEKITGFLYPKAIDKLLSENLRARKFYEKYPNKLEVSILLGLLVLQDATSNYWQDFGYKYSGPVILGYMQWLNKQLQNDKISEVLFVARDGYTLEKVFNLIKTSDFKTHYFYAPRNLNLAMHLNYEKNLALSEEQGILGIRTLLNYYRDKDDFLRQNTPEIQNSAEGIKFIEENRSLFEKLAQNEKKMYAKYFEQFQLKTNNIAMVDTCSTLLSAQKSLISGLPQKQIKGYYWFTWEGLQEDIKKYSTQTFQTSHKQEFIDWNIMELFMTAPTPPVEKIDGGEVIFRKINPNEAKRIEIYPDLSQGAINFANKYLDIFGKFSVDFSCDVLIDWINILCKIPTKIDKEHFISIQHAWNQEHTLWRPLPSPWFTTSETKYGSIKQIESAYLFGLPLFKIKKTEYRWNLKLFHFIPFIGYKKKINQKCFYLLSVPLFQIKNKTKNHSQKTVYSLFKFLPIISIKRK